jgi:hypothetical protein
MSPYDGVELLLLNINFGIFVEELGLLVILAIYLSQRQAKDIKKTNGVIIRPTHYVHYDVSPVSIDRVHGNAK